MLKSYKHIVFWCGGLHRIAWQMLELGHAQIRNGDKIGGGFDTQQTGTTVHDRPEAPPDFLMWLLRVSCPPRLAVVASAAAAVDNSMPLTSQRSGASGSWYTPLLGCFKKPSSSISLSKLEHRLYVHPVHSLNSWRPIGPWASSLMVTQR